MSNYQNFFYKYKISIRMGAVELILTIITITGFTSIIIYLSKKYDNYYWKNFRYSKKNLFF